MAELESHLQVTVDPHGQHLTLNGLGNNFEVDTSNNLSLRRENRAKSKSASHLLRHLLQTSLSSLGENVLSGVGLLSPSTNGLLSGTDIGVDTLALAQPLGLGFGETLRNLSLNTAQVNTTSHLEVTSISPGGVPGVSEEPVVNSVVIGSPSDHLDAVTTEVGARGLGVGTLRVEREEGVEVVEDGEASLEGTVGHQLGLVQVQIVVAETRERFERFSVVDGLPFGSVITKAGVALGRSSRSRVVGDTAREALLSTDRVTVVNNPLPGGRGETTVTTLLGALQDRLWGDTCARGGVSVDAETVGEGLHGAEVPARTTFFLVEDKEGTLSPFLTGVKFGGDISSQGHSDQDGEKGNLHHDCF